MGLLIIGNKNYSSWSLRPWLLMKVKDIPFEEERIALRTPSGRATLADRSPTGKVPVYIDNGYTIWDSLAICEYIADLYLDRQCWPADFHLRAEARAVSAEMHSGFSLIRNTLYMNCRKQMIYDRITPELQRELDRVQAIWTRCRERDPDGDFLFGDFCIADAMYAPMVLRFNSYGIAVNRMVRRYMESILDLPALQEWIAAAREEPEVMPEHEVL